LHKELIYIEAKIKTTKLYKYIKRRLARNTYKTIIKEIFVKKLYFKFKKTYILKNI